MKKIFFLAIVLSSCVHISNKEKPITASNPYFIVTKIEPVNDTLRTLCKYHIVADSSIVHSPAPGVSQCATVEVDIIDTAGKYMIHDTISLKKTI